MVVRAPDLGGCLCGDCLGPGLLLNGWVGTNDGASERSGPGPITAAALAERAPTEADSLAGVIPSNSAAQSLVEIGYE